MTTDPLTDHIDADVLHRCAGDVEAAAVWQIRLLRMQVAAAERRADEATDRLWKVVDHTNAERRRAAEPAALLLEIVDYAVGHSDAWSLPPGNIWRRAVETAARYPTKETP